MIGYVLRTVGVGAYGNDFSSKLLEALKYWKLWMKLIKPVTVAGGIYFKTLILMDKGP